MEPILEFRDRLLPTRAALAGYAFLIDRFDFAVPLPYELHAIADRQTRIRADGWVIHPNARWPGNDPVSHLLYAIRYEDVDLLVLKRSLERLGPAPLCQALRDKPSGAFVRRACFFYEWLIGEALPLDGIAYGNYVDALDHDRQFAMSWGPRNRKYKVVDNLPGTAAFCPLVSRTRPLEAFIKRNFRDQAQAIVESAPPELLYRASAYLVLKDSKASFRIEKEQPSRERAQLWANVIVDAGHEPLSVERLLELQRLVIEDDRFVTLGLRREGGFIGEHDPHGAPRPVHVDARHEDVPELLEGVVDFLEWSRRGNLHPVLAAACCAFGFVYIHPFEDGNGRIHRYIVHHVLAERGYTPEKIAFPISTAIEADLLGYTRTLESVSVGMTAHVEWRATARGNVEVLNDTADLYRYFDATKNAEFLFACIERTVERDLPDELGFLALRDGFHKRGTRIVDMPERTLDLLLHMLREKGGRFSKRMRSREFSALTFEEVEAFESLYADLTQPSEDAVGDLFEQDVEPG